MCCCDIDMAGFMVIVVSFVLHMITQGIPSSFGVVYTALLDIFHTGKGETSWVVSLNFGLLLGIGPVAGFLTQKYGCRTVAVVGSILAGVGMATSMFVEELYHLYFTFGCLTGIGFGLEFVVASVSVTVCFQDHKWQTFAIAIATTGANIGTMVFPFISRYFLVEYGWRGTFLLTSGIALQGVVVGSLLFPVDNKGKSSRPQKSEEAMKYRLINIFSNRSFVLFMISGTFTSLGYLVPLVMIPDMLVRRGYTTDQGAIIITVSGISGIVGRLLIGFLMDVLHAERVLTHAVTLVVGAISTAACVHLTHYWMFIAYGVVLGIFTDIFGFLQPAITNDLVNADNVSLGFGFNVFFEGIAITIGPPVAGLIADTGNGYHGAFYYAGAMFLMGALMAFWIPLCRRCNAKDSYTFTAG